MQIPDFSHLPVTIRRWKLPKRQTIEIHRGVTRVTEKGLFGTKWNEPISAFKGVLRRKDARSQPTMEGGCPVTCHLVELVHPHKDKTLLVHEATKEGGIRKLWHDAACALDLPALDETLDGIVSRTPEDLDKSIRDLAAEGKISVDFDAVAPTLVETPITKGMFERVASSN